MDDSENEINISNGEIACDCKRSSDHHQVPRWYSLATYCSAEVNAGQANGSHEYDEFRMQILRTAHAGLRVEINHGCRLPLTKALG